MQIASKSTLSGLPTMHEIYYLILLYVALEQCNNNTTPLTSEALSGSSRFTLTSVCN